MLNSKAINMDFEMKEKDFSSSDSKDDGNCAHDELRSCNKTTKTTIRSSSDDEASPVQNTEKEYHKNTNNNDKNNNNTNDAKTYSSNNEKNADLCKISNSNDNSKMFITNKLQKSKFNYDDFSDIDSSIDNDDIVDNDFIDVDEDDDDDDEDNDQDNDDDDDDDDVNEDDSNSSVSNLSTNSIDQFQCGVIFVSEKQQKFVCKCTLCDNKFKSVDYFVAHILNDHLNFVSDNDNDNALDDVDVKCNSSVVRRKSKNVEKKCNTIAKNRAANNRCIDFENFEFDQSASRSARTSDKIAKSQCRANDYLESEVYKKKLKLDLPSSAAERILPMQFETDGSSSKLEAILRSVRRDKKASPIAESQTPLIENTKSTNAVRENDSNQKNDEVKVDTAISDDKEQNALQKHQQQQEQNVNTTQSLASQTTAPLSSQSSAATSISTENVQNSSSLGSIKEQQQNQSQHLQHPTEQIQKEQQQLEGNNSIKISTQQQTSSLAANEVINNAHSSLPNQTNVQHQQHNAPNQPKQQQQQLQQHQPPPTNHQLPNLMSPATPQNLNLELNATNLEQLSSNLPFQNISPRSQRSIYTDISSPLTSILSPHSPHYTHHPQYMSPDSQYLSSNSILSPFSQHLSPHPNNFATPAPNTNPYHIYADSPASSANPLTPNENVSYNTGCKKQLQAPALPNIQATLDDLTNRQNHRDFSNNNQQQQQQQMTTNNSNTDFPSYKSMPLLTDLDCPSPMCVSQQYIPPPPTPTPTPLHSNSDNQTHSQPQYNPNNLSQIQTLNTVMPSNPKDSTSALSIMFDDNLQQQQQQMPINSSQQNMSVDIPSPAMHHHNIGPLTPNKPQSQQMMMKTVSHHHNSQHSNFQLSLPSPSPSLPEYDYMNRSSNMQNGQDQNNLSDICFKEPGSVTSYYSAPANLGSERILDDFTNITFPSLFKEPVLDTPKNVHGNLEDFYTEQLQNFLNNQIMSFDKTPQIHQNCTPTEAITTNQMNTPSMATNDTLNYVNSLNNPNTNPEDGHQSQIQSNENNYHSNPDQIMENFIYRNDRKCAYDQSRADESGHESTSNLSKSSGGSGGGSGISRAHFKPPSLLDSNKMLLSEHYINKITLFECKLCGKYYKNERSYAKHQKIHGDDCCKCQICGKYFQSRKRFLNHDQEMCKSRQDKRCKGRISKRMLASASLLESMDFSVEENIELMLSQLTNNNNNKNEINHNINDALNEGDDVSMQNSSFGSIKSNEDDQLDDDDDPLATKDELQHMNSKANGKQPKKCKHCPRTFLREVHLRAHERNHDMSFKCDYCPKSFRFRNALQIHIRSHTGEKPYKCAVCPAAFTTASNLKAHQLIHTDEKQFECTFGCGKTFPNKQLCKWHERVHTGEKPYQCDVCDKQFSAQSRLTLHRKQRHSVSVSNKNLRPHECTICSKRFLHPTGLLDHMNIHNGERPYECPLDNCDKRFPNQSRLWEHKTKFHTAFSSSLSSSSSSSTSYAMHHQRLHQCQYCNKVLPHYSALAMHKKFCKNKVLSSASASSFLSKTSIS